MATIKLGNLSQTSLASKRHFTVGDVIESNIGSDPVLVSDLTTLYRRYRYSKRYSQYKKLIEAGASLCLSGCGKMTSFPTLALFYTRESQETIPYLKTQISHSHPDAEMLYALESELLNYITPDAKRNPSQYTGYVQDYKGFSYQQIIEIDKEAPLWELFRDLVNLIDLENPDSEVITDPDQTFSVKSLYVPVPYDPSNDYSDFLSSIGFARFSIFNDNIDIKDLIANWYLIYNDYLISNTSFRKEVTSRVFPMLEDKYFNIVEPDFKKKGIRFDYSLGKDRFISTYLAAYKELTLEVYKSLGVATSRNHSISPLNTLSLQGLGQYNINNNILDTSGKLRVKFKAPNNSKIVCVYNSKSYSCVLNNEGYYTCEIDTQYGMGSNLSIQNSNKSIVTLSELQIEFEEYLVVITQEDNKLVLDFKYPTYTPDWNGGRFKYLKVKSSQGFTQNVYYYRGILNQGLFSSFVSTISGKEGTDTYVKLNAQGVTVENFNEYISTLFVKFFTEEYSYIGTLGFTDYIGNYSGDNPYMTLVDIRPPISSLDLPPPTQYYRLKYSEDPDITVEGMIRGYQSFEEYDYYVDVLLAPDDYLDRYLGRDDLRKAILDNTRTLNEGGFNSTLLISADDCFDQRGSDLTNERLIALKSIFNNDKCFFFSGSCGLPSRILYLVQWLSHKAFVPENLGDLNLFRIPNTLYLDYDGYKLLFKDDPDLQVELSLSNLSTNVRAALVPGNTKAKIHEDLIRAITTIKKNNPILDSITLDKITQQQNTLYVSLTTQYHRLNEIININFFITNYQ